MKLDFKRNFEKPSLKITYFQESYLNALAMFLAIYQNYSKYSGSALQL